MGPGRTATAWHGRTMAAPARIIVEDRPQASGGRLILIEQGNGGVEVSLAQQPVGDIAGACRRFHRPHLIHKETAQGT